MKILLFFLSLFLVQILFFPIHTEAAEIIQVMQGDNIVTISHPDTVIIGESFSVSVFIENNGTEEISNVGLALVFPEAAVDLVSPNASNYPSLLVGDNATKIYNFNAYNDVIPETYFLELQYNHEIIREDETLRTFETISIPILFTVTSPPIVPIPDETGSISVSEPAQITINATAPKEIFPDIEFILHVKITSENVDLKDVSLILNPPKELNFQGNFTHTFPSIVQNDPVTKIFYLITTEKDFENEQAVPIQIVVKHFNDLGIQKIDAKTIPLLLKPLDAEEEVMIEEEVIENKEDGGCLIATATYGSELAPQVQMLREIRDNSLLKTESGSTFMILFNNVYYSFSPSIADYERENPVFKQIVKLVITPLISSLSILNYVDMNSEQSVFGYGISLILMNVGMYFVAPAIVILRIKNLVNQKKTTY